MANFEGPTLIAITSDAHLSGVPGSQPHHASCACFVMDTLCTEASSRPGDIVLWSDRLALAGDSSLLSGAPASIYIWLCLAIPL